MNDGNPQQWAAILKTILKLQNLEAESDIAKQVIVAKGNQYCIVNQTQIDSSVSQLTLPQIVGVSLAKLKEVQEGYLKNTIKDTDYIHLTNDITDDTLQLITVHEKARDHSITQLLRKCALVLSALLSCIIIGIPFFLKLRQEDKKFRAEITSLKQSVLQAREDNSKAMLLKKINNIPSILEEIKKRFTDQRRQELINTQLLTDWLEDEKIPVESRPPYDAEFESDIKAGASFQRIDNVLNIEDKERLPALHLNAEQRIQEAAAFLKALLQDPGDQRWEPVLQLAVTHAGLFTAFKAALAAFNIDASNIQWENNGKYYSIKSISSDEFPPVILEIIRHPKTERIEQVNVTVKGSVNIVSYNIAESEASKMMISDAITEELRYSIIFGEDNRPIVRDLHSQLEERLAALQSYQPKRFLVT